MKANYMPKCYSLIGLPASGKSTWRENFAKINDGDNFVIVSSDDFIENYARENKMTYSEAYRTKIDGAEHHCRKVFNDAIAAKQNIVIDRTNMTRKSRGRFLSLLTKDYRKIAVVFTVPDEELQTRLHNRGTATGKWIPGHVIDNMRRTYQEPQELDNEFDEIIFENF